MARITPPGKRIVKKQPKVSIRHKSGVDLERIDALSEQIMVLRKDIKNKNDDVKDMQEELTDLMKQASMKTRNWVDASGNKHRTVMQQNTSDVIDEVRLKKSLGSKLWDMVSTRSLDKKKLDACIASGEVDPVIVAQATTERQGNPFVKVT